MKILFAASECVPFIKTGGLADVVGALSKVLAQQGHDVRVILPFYTQISDQYASSVTHVTDFTVSLGWRNQYCGIEALQQDNVTFYFVDNKYYFGRQYIYGYGTDEAERFGFFCRSIADALEKIDFRPDVLHCNDWQTGMVPVLLKTQYAHLPYYSNIKTVFTVHNLQYQGIFPIETIKELFGFPYDLFTSDKLECYGNANFMKAALVYADELTTVSPSYSEEIKTAYYGEHLDGILRARSNNLTGILNGIDVNSYDPSSDAALPARYSAEDLSGKATCKRMLQEEMGLVQDASVPVIAMIGRLSDQKGLDLVDRVIDEIMNLDVELVILGMGEAKYTNLFSWAEQHYSGRVAARFKMDEQLARRIYAGADIFLMPSQFEPCGLSQMMALRYGTIPIVRETGGLRDTVLSYNEYSGAGNGFSFFNYNAHDMLYTIGRAVHYYRTSRGNVWQLLQKRGMEGDYSWYHASKTYLDLYESVTGLSAAAAGKKTTARKTARKTKAEAADAAEAPKKTTASGRKKAAAEKPEAKKAAAAEKTGAKKNASPKAAAKKAAAPAETEEKPAKKPARSKKTLKAEE